MNFNNIDFDKTHLVKSSKDLNIKSKDRVRDLGEVFTPANTVIDMLEMVSDKEFSKKTILEPTCGTGNFIIGIVCKKYFINKNVLKINNELSLLYAINNTFGIDIMEDNIVHTKQRLMCLVKYIVSNVKQLLCFKHIIDNNFYVVTDSSDINVLNELKNKKYFIQNIFKHNESYLYTLKTIPKELLNENINIEYTLNNDDTNNHSNFIGSNHIFTDYNDYYIYYYYKIYSDDILKDILKYCINNSYITKDNANKFYINNKTKIIDDITKFLIKTDKKLNQILLSNKIIIKPNI